MSFALLTDSASNLPLSLVRSRNIEVLAFEYTCDGECFSCFDSDRDYEEKGREYYNRMRKGKLMTTSLINSTRFSEAFEAHLARGEDVLFVSLSSGVSGACRSAEMAAEDLRQKYPDRLCLTVDTLAASLGEGLQVLAAADLRDEGVEVDTVAARLIGARQQIRQEFTVDDLTYLKRSGRISAATMLIGTLLHIKPLLRGDESGKIVSYGKVQGRRRALDALAASYCKTVSNPARTIGIAHADAPEDAAYLLAAIRTSVGEVPAIVVCYDLCTGAHVGPGTVALFWESKHR